MMNMNIGKGNKYDNDRSNNFQYAEDQNEGDDAIVSPFMAMSNIRNKKVSKEVDYRTFSDNFSNNLRDDKNMRPSFKSDLDMDRK